MMSKNTKGFRFRRNSNRVIAFNIEGMKFVYEPSAEKAERAKELSQQLKMLVAEKPINESAYYEIMVKLTETVLGHGAINRLTKQIGRSLTIADYNDLLRYLIMNWNI